jgi:predicted  nucleic acid-binding Zn-ribbon protein
MITPEQLISDLQKENERLKEELEQAQKDVRDFEVLAAGWKKGYDENIGKLKIQLINAKQEIEELKEELEAFVSNGPFIG